ncbi:hypothetical protein [Streptomyces malaysiensis]|uniref:hypothetical protein n=1 Tax=Streptomyces malaysiensis TaxID=92644 RepID=UPI00368DA30C
MSAQWARPFLLHLPDGRTYSGACFPSGHVAVNHPDQDDQPYIMTLATTMDHLLTEQFLHAAVEWPEEA